MNSAELQVLESRLGTTAADYEMYLTQERDHLAALKREPPEVIWTVDYMELLEKRYAAECVVRFSWCALANTYTPFQEGVHRCGSGPPQP